MTTTTTDFTQSFDARDWAAAFVQHVQANPEIATDESTMLGWFANAIMRGYDEHARRYPGSESEKITARFLRPNLWQRIRFALFSRPRPTPTPE